MSKPDFDQPPLALANELFGTFNSRDFAALLEASDGHIDYTEIGTGRHIVDADEFVAALQGWTSAFPDLTATVLSAMRDDDRLCVEVVWEGTHTGPLVTAGGTLPPSGNRVSTRAVHLFTIGDGRVLAETAYLDLMGLMNQIAAAPEQSQAVPGQSESRESAAPAQV